MIARNPVTYRCSLQQGVGVMMCHYAVWGPWQLYPDILQPWIVHIKPPGFLSPGMLDD